MPKQTHCSFCGVVLLVKMYYYRYRKKQLGREPIFFCSKTCHTNSMKKDPKKKTKSAASAKRAVQNLVNKYCRMRDCYGNDGTNCISCGQWFPYERLDGGHFIPTTSSATRFDERNVNAQCHRCNRFLHGNAHNYYVGMVKKYGQEVVDELMAQQHDSKRWSSDELKALRIYFNDKIRRLERGEPPAEVPDHSGLAVLDMFTGVDETG